MNFAVYASMLGCDSALSPEMINNALDAASCFAAEICLIDGAFGCSEKIQLC